jgi:ketosteroid isomerase-like protein
MGVEVTMTARVFLAALLLNTLPLAGQTRPAAPPLEAAEAAFVKALAVPDRDVFRQLLAPDTVFFFPVEARGPEAIVEKWLPFLLDPALTLALAIDTSTTAQSGEIGQTVATFAIKGRTNAGMRTTPAGSFSIAWRLVDGQWKIRTLSGAGKGGVKLAHRGGVGGFRFGMSRTEVSRVPDCQPYTNVSSTGGIECPNYLFDGRKMNISFLFNGDELRRIQLWFYNGPSETEAREAIGVVIDHLKKTAGGARVNGLPELEVTPDAVMNVLNGGPLRPGAVAQVEISTPTTSEPEAWFARVGRHQFGYPVMLFADSR